MLGKTTTLKVGDQAPALRLSTAGGRSYSLKQFYGKSTVVLIFIRGTW